LVLTTLLGSVGEILAQPYGLESRPALGAFLNDAFPKATPGIVPGGYSTVEAFPNLTFDDPVSLIAEPDSDRLYVCGRQGTIHFFTNNPATSTKVLFLDLTPVTQGYDDCGLMGMAFHPEFRQVGSTNRGFVYVYYQYSPAPTSGPGRPPSATPGYNRLSRFTVPDGSMVVDPASELILINQFDRHVWHNGGGMFFGPDGFLYLTNGDEGAANDSYNQT
jgi:glucose/arabinose dehydrogenase